MIQIIIWLLSIISLWSLNAMQESALVSSSDQYSINPQLIKNIQHKSKIQKIKDIDKLTRNDLLDTIDKLKKTNSEQSLLTAYIIADGLTITDKSIKKHTPKSLSKRRNEILKSLLQYCNNRAERKDKIKTFFDGQIKILQATKHKALSQLAAASEVTTSAPPTKTDIQLLDEYRTHITNIDLELALVTSQRVKSSTNLELNHKEQKLNSDRSEYEVKIKELETKIKQASSQESSSYWNIFSWLWKQ